MFKAAFTFILIICISQLAFGQVDSLAEKAIDKTNIREKLSSAFAKTDSAQAIVDSLNVVASFQWVKDSLTLEAWSASMKAGIQNKFNKDSIQLNKKIDSLQSLHLPTERLEYKLDSLKSRQQALIQEVNSKQKELLNKTEERINSWKQKVQSKVDSMGIKAALPGVDIPDLQQLNIPELNIPEMPSLSVDDFSDMSLSTDLANINTSLPFKTPEGLAGIQENLTSITDKASALSQLKTNPDKGLQQAIGNIDAVKELNQFKELKNQLPANNPDAVKQQLTQQAINHFAGKEEVLQAAMTEVSKYKQKYSDVHSLADLPKKKPNAMRGKPFIERFVPGVAFQYQYNNGYLVDINGYGGYRLTERITTGMGWNQRVVRDASNEYWDHQAAIYGARVYGNYELGKGFIVHLETEVMNAFVSSVPANPTIETGKREWVWGMMTGMKKTYKITRNLKGTVIILFNIFDPNYKSPYNDRLNSRIGVEYYFKKRPSK